MMINYKELEDLGLSEKEAKVYLASLELGPATANQIAQKAGVNRATAYVQIDELTKLGLMSSFERKKKTFFSAESPEALRRILAQKEEKVRSSLLALKKVLPGLLKAYEYAEERPKVRFFEGKEGIEAIRQDILKSKIKSLDEIVNLDEAYRLFPPTPLDWREKMKKIPGRVIYTHTKGKILPEKEQRIKRKFISSEKFPFTAEIIIYPPKVAFITLKGKLIGVIIDNEEISESLKLLIDLAWAS